MQLLAVMSIDTQSSKSLESHELDPARWLLYLTTLLLLSSAVGVYYVANRFTPYTGVLGRPGMLRGLGPIVSLQEFSSEGVTANLTGRNFSIRDVEVTRAVGDYTFWVAEGGVSVPAVLQGERSGRQAEHVTDVQHGDRVHISGTVQTVYADSLGHWSHLLDASERERVLEARVYLLVNQLEKIPPQELSK